MDIPPEFVYAPVSLVYGDLPRSIALTGLRIWGLGWRRGYDSAAPVGEDELLVLCRISRSTLYAHLARLSTLGVLRFSSTNGEYSFTFNKVKPMLHSPENRTEQSRKSDYSPENWTGVSPENRTAIVVVDSPPSVSASTEGKRIQQQHISSTGGECEGGGEQSDFLDRLALLDALGIVGTVQYELARLAWATPGYLEAWVDWATQDVASVGLRGAYYVTQIRAGARAPRAQMGRVDVEELPDCVWAEGAA